MARYVSGNGRLAVTTVTLMLFAAPAGALAQELAVPGLRVVHRSEMPVAAQTEPASIIHGVLVFEPGSRFPEHSHGGPALYTIVDSSVLVEDGGNYRPYGAGESYVQATGHVLAARNVGSGPSSMAVAFVLAQGKELTVFAPGQSTDKAAPAPQLIHNVASEPLTISEPATVVQMLVELEQGSTTPVFSHPGPSMATVLEGEVTLRRTGEAERTFKAGEGWLVKAAERFALANPSGTVARLAASYFLRDSEKLVTVH